MSKLIVEVCSIEEINPIPNADRIVAAKIKGWQCIVGKNQFKVGDSIIFVPPDALLPDTLIASEGLSYLKKGNRVQVTKLKGFVSQGLALTNTKGYPVGKDVADELGITKWEAPERTGSGPKNAVKIRKCNQHFDKFTDIQNIKHFPTEIFEVDEQVVILEKVHGANWRCGSLEIGSHQDFISNLVGQIRKWFGHTHEFVYGSHNVQLQWFNKKNCFYKTNYYLEVVEKYGLDKICANYKDITFYGEVYGEGVQDLTYGIKGRDLVIFDIKVRTNDSKVYLDHAGVETICRENNLPMAPVLYEGPWKPELVDMYTKGKSILCPNQIREGFVIKPVEEQFHPKLGRKILKSVSEDYLTRKGATEFK